MGRVNAIILAAGRIEKRLTIAERTDLGSLDRELTLFIAELRQVVPHSAFQLFSPAMCAGFSGPSEDFETLKRYFASHPADGSIEVDGPTFRAPTIRPRQHQGIGNAMMQWLRAWFRNQRHA